MSDSKYVLRYLPKFYEDLENKTMYIAEKLQNPQAAHELIDAVEKQYSKGKRMQKLLKDIIQPMREDIHIICLSFR